MLIQNQSTSLAAAAAAVIARHAKLQLQQHVKQLKPAKQYTPFDFISHPTGTVLRVLNRKQKQSRNRSASLMEVESATMETYIMNSTTIKRLPGFISHPNGILLRVLNKKQLTTETG